MLTFVLVDAHTHLLPERLAAAIRRYFEEHIADDLPYPWEASRARDELRAAGVTRCWSLPYAHRAGMASGLNRWMAEAFPPADPLVIPGATLHPEDDVARLLDEALDELKLRVLKLHCGVGGFAPDDPRLDPLWRRVSETGHPVVVHVGRSVQGTTDEEELLPLARVAERWPEARIVVAHCGAPAVGPTLDLVRRARFVHADLTPVVRRLVPLTRRDMAGVERKLLFGSDIPNTVVTIEEALALVRSWGLSVEDETAVLGGNAQALIG
jgi:predicted TIM-barrel fold metal-dependent hydrolase